MNMIKPLVTLSCKSMVLFMKMGVNKLNQVSILAKHTVITANNRGVYNDIMPIMHIFEPRHDKTNKVSVRPSKT